MMRVGTLLAKGVTTQIGTTFAKNLKALLIRHNCEDVGHYKQECPSSIQFIM